MEEFITAAIGLSGYTWRQIVTLAEELRDHSILPVTGAGASRGCDVEPKVPSAPGLARRLHDQVMDGTVSLSPRPSGFRGMRGQLGDVAEAVCLQNKPSVVLEALGFSDEKEWPGPESIAVHACAYRVLARMARERLIEETLTFNYDCHNEAACIAEGFLDRDDELDSQIWPSRYGAVATDSANARLQRRADFTVVKAHGCVECWRREHSSWVHSGSEPDPAEKIVIRKSQLLDWRGDNWIRDLVADRARRHVLILIGCSAEDPVIQISLKRIMDEVRKVDPDGPARIRVLDINPTTLALRTVLKASGVGPGHGDRMRAEIRVPGENKSNEMGGVLIALLTEMATVSLRGFPAPWTEVLPEAIGARTVLLALTAPVMVRWSWWLLSKRRAGQMGFAVDLRRGGDACYVPLLADPLVTLRAAAARRRLLGRLGRELETNLAEVDRTGFVIAGGAAAIPLGVSPEEFEAAPGLMAEALAELAAPRLDLYAALAVDGPEDLSLYSIPSGKKVTGEEAPF